MKDDEDRLAYALVVLGLGLRVYAALAHLDISHPDEHFQSLEPASRVVFGFGWRSWEWIEGARSWFVPALYMPVLGLFKLFGVRGGPGPILACRVLMAAASTLGLRQFWVLLRESGFKRGACLIGLAVFALSPAMAAWGAMTLSDVWAMIFLLGALPRVLRSAESGRGLFSAGLLLGLSFLARIQMAVFAAGLAGLFFLRGCPPRAQVLRFLLGYGLPVLGQGLLDWATWGHLFHSLVENLSVNLLQSGASFYGTAPFYAYFLLVPKNLGWPLCAFVAAAVLGAALAGLSKLGPRDVLVAIPALLYFIAHCLIAHKETRFLLPLFPAAFYFLAWALSGFEDQLAPLLRLPEPALALAALAAALASSRWVYSSDHTYEHDLSELSLAIRADGGLKEGGCLLLVGHTWVWTRGDLMIGASVEPVETAANQPLPAQGLYCSYAITLAGGQDWLARNGLGGWKLLKIDGHGQLLFKRG